MSNEKLLKDLLRVKEGNYDLLDEIITNIKLDIKSNASYKTTNRTRLNAIKKVLNKNKDIRPILSAYHVNYNNKIEFTDSYRAYELNETELPFKKVVDKEDKDYDADTMIVGCYPSLTRMFKKEEDMDNDDYTKINIDINDIIGAYKTREDKYTTYSLYAGDTEIRVNVSYLKETLDILGKDITCYGKKKNEPIYLYNKNNETCLLLPIMY